MNLWLLGSSVHTTHDQVTASVRYQSITSRLYQNVSFHTCARQILDFISFGKETEERQASFIHVRVVHSHLSLRMLQYVQRSPGSRHSSQCRGIKVRFQSKCLERNMKTLLQKFIMGSSGTKLKHTLARVLRKSPESSTKIQAHGSHCW